ncbi:BON domain-containing protein [Chitinimonas sp. BJB300]|uniref:BON domain-containing protein n=1 Tax=Chitinimonas sp. BJB300 TaxID=1559339 RepID=UPI0013042730|nr:BON domain-containing protein [Chitinimonas sp. BJB300]
MKRPHIIFSTLALLIALLGLSACDSHHLPHTDTDASNGVWRDAAEDSRIAAGIAAAAEEEKNKGNEAENDVALTSEVKTALVDKAGVGTLRLDVSSDQGVVTINGTVPGSQQSDTVHKVTKNVQGVESVENNVTVKGR